MLKCSYRKAKGVTALNIRIGITADGVKQYPPHKHEFGEIMTYISGSGYLYTPEKNYAFERGTMIFVPPGVVHGSVSEGGFKNISIGGDFDELMLNKEPVSVGNITAQNGISMAKIIYSNRYANDSLLHSLCTAFVCLFMQGVDFEENEVAVSIHEIVNKINDNAFDTRLNLCEILNGSGYSEDYIRAKFRQHTGKTPTEFLTEIRMRRARLLIEIYGKRLAMQEIALRCGYCDYVYFSKRFKKFAGCSPNEYRRRVSV